MELKLSNGNNKWKEINILSQSPHNKLTLKPTELMIQFLNFKIGNVDSIILKKTDLFKILKGLQNNKDSVYSGNGL